MDGTDEAGGGPTAAADRSSATGAAEVGADMGAEMGADTGADTGVTSAAAATAGGGGATGETTAGGGATGATEGATCAGIRGGAPHTDVPMTLDSVAGATIAAGRADGPTGAGGTAQAPASAVVADATASSDDCWYMSLSVRRGASLPPPTAAPRGAERGGMTTAAVTDGGAPTAPADPCRAPAASDGAAIPIGGGGAPLLTGANGTGGDTPFGGGGRWSLDAWAAAAAAADRGGTR